MTFPKQECSKDVAITSPSSPCSSTIICPSACRTESWGGLGWVGVGWGGMGWVGVGWGGWGWAGVGWGVGLGRVGGLGGGLGSSRTCGRALGILWVPGRFWARLGCTLPKLEQSTGMLPGHEQNHYVAGTLAASLNVIKSGIVYNMASPDIDTIPWQFCELLMLRTGPEKLNQRH